MDINHVTWCPAWVSKSLNRLEFIPFTRFGIIDFQRNNFSNLISSTTNNHHEWSQEQSWMLISRNRTFGLVLVWSFNPIPSSISMSSKTPRIKQTTLISSSTTKTYHHARSTSSLTKSSRVINSYLRSFSTAIKFNPREGSFFNTKAPDIIDCFLTSVSTKNEKVWFWKYNTVTISSTRSWTNDWNDHPLGLIFTISHI